MTIIEKARHEVAQGLDLVPEQVRLLRANWDTYMRAGLVVRVHIGRWRAKTALDLQDLGLPTNGNQQSRLIKLGEKRLLPVIPPNSQFYDEKKPERTYAQLLDSVESAGRNWLRSVSFDTFWGSFVPATAFQEWREKDNEYRQQYLAVRDEIGANWDAIVEGLLNEYAEVAQEAWLRMRQLGPDELAARDWLELDAYTDAFLARITQLLPGREEFSRSFYWTPELNFIPLPDLLAEELAEAERIQHKRFEEEARHNRLIARIATEEAMHKTALEAREQQLFEMNRAVLEQARWQKEELVDGFITDVMGQIRRLIYDVTTNVYDSISSNNGKLVGKSSQQLTNLIDQVRRLNFTGDQELEAMLSPVRNALTKEPESRNVFELQERLRDIAIVSRVTLLALGDESRGARADIGIPDLIPAGLERQARANLELTGDVPELVGTRQARLEL